MKPLLLIVDDGKTPSREGLRAALEGQYEVYVAGGRPFRGEHCFPRSLSTCTPDLPNARGGWMETSSSGPIASPSAGLHS